MTLCPCGSAAPNWSRSTFRPRVGVGEDADGTPALHLVPRYLLLDTQWLHNAGSSSPAGAGFVHLVQSHSSFVARVCACR